MENIHRIHNNSPPRTDSRIYERTTVLQSSSKVGSSSCQCSTTLYGEKKKMQRNVKSNSHEVAKYARRFPCVHWSFLRPGSEKKWYGTYSDKHDGVWDKTVEEMMIEFSETAHPIFRASSTLVRGELRSEGKGQEDYPYQR